jgi:aminoglycoside phosphotransferase family enzyme
LERRATVNHYSWLQDYLARLDGKEARREYYERYYASWHETAQKLAEAILESHRMLSNYSVEAHERHTQLTRSFFTSVDSIIRAQVESNLAASRRLAEQAVKGQEAAQSLTRESANAYMDFLDSMFSYYWEIMKTTESSRGRQPRF